MSRDLPEKRQGDIYLNATLVGILRTRFSTLVNVGAQPQRCDSVYLVG